MKPTPGKKPTELGSLPLASLQECRASDICLRLLASEMRAAASRTFCTAGSNRPIRMAMIAITTNSSISVKPHGFTHARNLAMVPP